MRRRDRTPIRVLRLCSVFEPPASAIEGKGARFDPIGGMQNHTAELTRALDRRGVRQTVLTTRPPTAPHLQRLGDHARVIRLGFPLRRFRQLYGLQAAVSAPILAARADLVHVHLGEDLAILPIGVAAAKLHRLPLVLTVHLSLRHTLIVADLRSAVLKALGSPIERWGERSAEAVVAITPRLGRLLVSEGVDPQRVHAVPPGVNAALFAGSFEDPFPLIGRPRVAFVSRLAAQKGLRFLIAAVASLKTPGVQVLLVLPSVYEELGTVLLEAMWMGLPVVASRTGGIPDVITNEVDGLLVQPGRPEALAVAIDRVLRSPVLAQRLGEAARERVLEIYRGITTGRS